MIFSSRLSVSNKCLHCDMSLWQSSPEVPYGIFMYHRGIQMKNNAVVSLKGCSWMYIGTCRPDERKRAYYIIIRMPTSYPRTKHNMICWVTKTGWQDENKTVRRGLIRNSHGLRQNERDDIVLHKRFNHLTCNTRNHFSFWI